MTTRGRGRVLQGGGEDATGRGVEGGGGEVLQGGGRGGGLLVDRAEPF